MHRAASDRKALVSLALRGGLCECAGWLLLDARGEHCASRLGGHEDLLVPRVRLEQDPIVGPAQDAVQDSQLLEVVLVTAKLANDFHEEGLLHALLDPAQLAFWADEDEVVSVHHAAEVALRVLVAAGAG